MDVKKNGDVSFWYADIGGVPGYRPPLQGDIVADVCIVGAGYTGLWTAYYLKQAAPHLNIVVIEKEFAGFGASGRNGGWLSGGFSWSREKYEEATSRAGVIAMQAAMTGTVNEVISVAEAEGIDADIRRTDELLVATNEAQEQRAKAMYAHARSWALTDERVGYIDAAEMRRRIAVHNARGAFVIKKVARIQPAKLVQGLARAVERLGIPIYEQTTVLSIESGKVATNRGVVRAEKIVRATEGFTAGIAGHERLWLALNSAIVVTEPLSDKLWSEIGWDGYEVLGDAAHTYCYAQRTREGRIAMGGRGVPYRFGSKTDVRGVTQQATIDKLHKILTTLLPQTKGLKLDHAWCGTLGVPRDWCTTVGFDRQTGIGWAGGYVGLGVSTSNLSGRTLRDLLLGNDTELTRLPWVNRTVRKWEPEPLRWLGVHSMYQLYRIADEREAKGLPRTSRLAALADRITGH
ncbi:MAG: FAD-dependent oxidoreductase [Mesorhizobium sp.]|jgi:glycine/D-amino acid oxidase-like deaminating enzyme|uniref:NAD(P)/FAD-dependent oxidoreductase n=1 Tax=Mesorhizobium sp. TaxID=1871066 RepID=UPI000FE3DD6C|nr:FAD-binding oxidoreductase [Mesorhizobium sp.]RWN64164.1 MAG: FAD-dependent oxidoreductase [Mesorhizobium sp.]RWO32403.1 MAG: FAD-dependent oxidoreductase [Mesorhizobium sp.]RWO40859.1 MAG: FAD-dependent oxidoreductase [Mesorhizobium sp.]RWP65317.1 MAG: FAD-dependent oxidoreductase [Mesorhizobium sp.]RWP67810.1 MAG: FAD-dependent oxidoreductase [Mesorhizobium sp.]